MSLNLVVRWWLKVPIAGSPILRVMVATLYALTIAALGILLGTIATTIGRFAWLAVPVVRPEVLVADLSESKTP